jgi:hypothetical protein
MLFMHEVHTVRGRAEDDFEAAFRDGWMPTLGAGDEARLLWYANHAHGTGPATRLLRTSAWLPLYWPRPEAVLAVQDSVGLSGHLGDDVCSGMHCVDKADRLTDEDGSGLEIFCGNGLAGSGR